MVGEGNHGWEERSQKRDENDSYGNDERQENAAEQQERISDWIVGFTESIRFRDTIPSIRERPERTDAHRIDYVSNKMRTNAVERTQATDYNSICRSERLENSPEDEPDGRS